MDYRLDKCPRCHLTPVEVHDVPSPFPPEGKAPLECHHCGAPLWAIALGKDQRSDTRIVFRLRRDE
jgi:hypothetical protein